MASASISTGRGAHQRLKQKSLRTSLRERALERGLLLGREPSAMNELDRTLDVGLRVQLAKAQPHRTTRNLRSHTHRCEHSRFLFAMTRAAGAGRNLRGMTQ